MIARETCRIILPVTLHTKQVKPSTVDVEMHYYQQEIEMVKVAQAIYITLIPRWPLNSSHEVLSEAAAYHSHSYVCYSIIKRAKSLQEMLVYSFCKSTSRFLS